MFVLIDRYNDEVYMEDGKWKRLTEIYSTYNTPKNEEWFSELSLNKPKVFDLIDLHAEFNKLTSARRRSTARSGIGYYWRQKDDSGKRFFVNFVKPVTVYGIFQDSRE